MSVLMCSTAQLARSSDTIGRFVIAEDPKVKGLLQLSTAAHGTAAYLGQLAHVEEVMELRRCGQHLC